MACANIAEEPDNREIEKLLCRDTNLLQACIQNKVPCPHSLCSQNKDRFYTDLEQHYRVAHSRVRFSSEIKKAAVTLKEELHFNELKTYLETSHRNKIKVGLSVEETDFTIMCGNIKQNIISEKAEVAVKKFGLLLQSKGILDKYSKGSTGTTVRVTSKDEFICFNLWYAVCDGLVEKETMSYIRIIMEPVFVKELQVNSSLDMHSVSGSHQNMPVEVHPSGSADTRNSNFVNFGETFDETTIAELNKDKLLNTLRSVFHLREFKQEQGKVIESVMSGSHTIAIMPTGSGKSLCFQLPAFIFMV